MSEIEQRAVTTEATAAHPYASSTQTRLIPVTRWPDYHDWPSVAGLRWMIFNAKEKGFPFVYLLDEGQEIFPQYGASRTPEIYLLDATHKLRYHGAIDDNSGDAEAVTVNYVEKAVAALENGKDPDPSDIKAVGCSIKVKKS